MQAKDPLRGGDVVNVLRILPFLLCGVVATIGCADDAAQSPTTSDAESVDDSVTDPEDAASPDQGMDSATDTDDPDMGCIPSENEDAPVGMTKYS